MFTNYLKVAFRNIIKHKGYSFINIAGLAVGMAVCILIILWIQHEVSFNRFHENVDRIHLLVTSQPLETGLHTLYSQVSTVGPLLKDKIPEVEDHVRIYTPDMVTLTYGEKAFQENPSVRAGANVVEGQVTYKGVADAYDIEYVAIDELL